MKKALFFAIITSILTLTGNAQTWDLIGNSTMGTEVLGTSNSQSLNIITNGSTRMTIKPDGNIGIGTTKTSGFLLSVDGKVRTREVFINLDTWADYVFESDYYLMPLSELEAYLATHKHLPGVPSANEMTSKEQSVSDTQIMLMEKVEELSLYIIELNNRIVELEDK